MGPSARVMAFIMVIDLMTASSGFTLHHHDSIPVNYPQSLEDDLKTVMDTIRAGQVTPALLVALAEVYRDLADDLYTDDMRRQRTYGAGATAALRAVELDEGNADAHFLYAVNLGSEARLKGLSAAAGALSEIQLHVRHAIELNPNHAPALQFMGGLLAELPWFLGGNEKEAQRYLERAVTADGNYTHARILLAKLYLKHNRVTDARRQLDAVIHARAPHYPYTWRQKFKPEAEALLEKLGGGD